MTREIKRPPKIKRPCPEIPANPESLILSNGAKLYLFPSSKTEIVRLDLLFKAGHTRQVKPLQAHLTSLMLCEGTRKNSAKEIGELFDFYGTLPDLSAGPDYSSLRIMMLPEHYHKVAELIHELLYSSIFPEEELRTHISNEKEKFITSRRRASVLSFDNFLELIFGTDHPLGVITGEEHFRDIVREDIISFHESFYINEPPDIALSGNISRELISLTTSIFQEIPAAISKSKGEIEKPEAVNGKPETRKRVIPMSGTVQSSINIGRRDEGLSHPDFPARKVVNTIIGGYFGSRLMQSLREKHGFTYGTSSWIMPIGNESVMAVTTEVGKEVTQRAVDAIYHEFDKLCSKPVGNKELRLVKNSMMGSMTRQFDGPFARCSSFISVARYGMDMDYYRILKETILNITPDEIKRVAETYYNSRDMYEVTAG